MGTLERRVFSEQFSPQEQTQKTTETHRVYDTHLILQDVQMQKLRRIFTEKVSFYGALLRVSHGVLSDIVIGAEMSMEEFRRFCNQPVGYEPFAPFYVGEYEYQRALVRISMRAGSIGALPQIYDVVMNVDIEDTVDRGTANIAAKETAVPYHKHYYTKPEVTVTLQAGNTGDGIITPVLTTVGTESFRCVLRKEDGTHAAGTISWTAIGY